MINGGGKSISNSALTDTITLHKNHPVFLRRKITTSLIDFFTEILNIKTGLSFVLINFFFLFLSGLILYYLAFDLSKSKKFSLVSMLAFFLCFSNLFAFFPPVYTYDEPLQFCFILLSLLLFFREKYWSFILVFSFSIIIRESSVLLIPGLFLTFIYDSNKDLKENLIDLKTVTKTFGLLVPFLVYGIYLYFVMTNNQSSDASKEYFLQRFYFVKWNFQNTQFAIESICSMLLIFALPLYLVFRHFKEKRKSHKMVKAFLITFILNSAVVLLNTKAREVRLFVLPMFFLWPIFGLLFTTDLSKLLKLYNYRKAFSNYSNLFLLFILILISFIFSFIIYFPTVGPRVGIFNLYLFILFIVIFVHVFIEKGSTKRVNNQ